MIAWLLKKTARLTQPATGQHEPVRAGAPGDCPLWHDVARALDAKPKGQAK